MEDLPVISPLYPLSGCTHRTTLDVCFGYPDAQYRLGGALCFFTLFWLLRNCPQIISTFQDTSHKSLTVSAFAGSGRREAPLEILLQQPQVSSVARGCLNARSPGKNIQPDVLNGHRADAIYCGSNNVGIIPQRGPQNAGPPHCYAGHW